MRYLVLLHGNQPASPPPAELMTGIMALGTEATQSGSLLDTAGLLPHSTTRLTVRAGALSVNDGPFTETKELISYALYDVRSREEAVEWTRRFLALHRDLWAGWEGDAEVVQVMGPEDFAPPASQD
jgi:hypothetical protein